MRVMHSQKRGDAVCYEYRAKNGFGGVSFERADYAAHNKKALERGEYLIRIATEETSPFDGGFEYFSRCGKRAIHGDKFVKDVTEEVKKALPLDGGDS